MTGKKITQPADNFYVNSFFDYKKILIDAQLVLLDILMKTFLEQKKQRNELAQKLYIKNNKEVSC